MFIDKNLANALAKQNSKILNSGTSEGVKKAWEARHAAFGQSTTANGMSSNQTTDQPAAYHSLASQSHQLASFKHGLAANLAAENGDSLSADMHRAQQANHDNLARYHDQTASNLKALANPKPVNESPYKAAILPIGNVNLTTHSNETFGKVWDGWEHGKGSNLVMQQGDKTRAVHTSRDHDVNVSQNPVGSKYELRHDQTGRPIGDSFSHWKVTGVFPHTAEGMSQIKAHTGRNSLPFSTFK